METVAFHRLQRVVSFFFFGGGEEEEREGKNTRRGGTLVRSISESRYFPFFLVEFLGYISV